MSCYSKINLNPATYPQSRKFTSHRKQNKYHLHLAGSVASKCILTRSQSWISSPLDFFDYSTGKIFTQYIVNKLLHFKVFLGVTHIAFHNFISMFFHGFLIVRLLTRQTSRIHWICDICYVRRNLIGFANNYVFNSIWQHHEALTRIMANAKIWSICPIYHN